MGDTQRLRELTACMCRELPHIDWYVLLSHTFYRPAACLVRQLGRHQGYSRYSVRRRMQANHDARWRR